MLRWEIGRVSHGASMNPRPSLALVWCVLMAATIHVAACSRRSADPPNEGPPPTRARGDQAATVTSSTVVGNAPVVGGVQPIVALDLHDEQPSLAQEGLPVLDQYL